MKSRQIINELCTQSQLCERHLFIYSTSVSHNISVCAVCSHHKVGNCTLKSCIIVTSDLIADVVLPVVLILVVLIRPAHESTVKSLEP